MMKISYILSIIFIILNLFDSMAQDTSRIPLGWVDTITGHKIIRLTRSGTENQSFYFHNNPFLKTKENTGSLMVYYSKVQNSRQLFVLNLNTFENTQLTYIPGRKIGEIVAPKLREVIYQVGDSILATQIDTRSTRLIYVFPQGLGATIYSLNANETLLAGKYSEGNKVKKILQDFPEKHDFFTKIYEAKIKHYLFTLNILTGEMKVIHEENDWTNHIQFSPANPDILMFCHEGPWHKVDRIWTINLKDGKVKLMHKRIMDREIAGHEFFSPDGKTIWFDLQRPRSENFFLAGVDIETGKETKYSLTRNQWSIHFTISPDQTMFSGDGGDSSQVAKANDGMWIYLFRPINGKFVSEKLVNMKYHYYKLEPNVHFSPDGKWVIFRSNMYGETQIYAVEINK